MPMYYSARYIDGLIKRFESKLGYTPNIKAPQTLNEKILRRKLTDRRELLVQLTDKLASKEYVKGKIKTIPNLRGVHNFPVVVKSNHWSGNVKACFNGEQLEKALEVIESTKRKKYGHDKGEWAYSEIPYSVIYEPLYLNLHEVKLFMFNGKCELIRYMPPRTNYDTHPPELEGSSHFYPNGNHIEITHGKYPMGVNEIPDHVDIDECIKVGEEICKGIDFVRLDLYWNGSPVFGEFTFYPGSGHTLWSDPTFDEWLGGLWN
jgi:hypothetical protein